MHRGGIHPILFSNPEDLPRVRTTLRLRCNPPKAPTRKPGSERRWSSKPRRQYRHSGRTHREFCNHSLPRIRRRPGTVVANTRAHRSGSPARIRPYQRPGPEDRSPQADRSCIPRPRSRKRPRTRSLRRGRNRRSGPPSSPRWAWWPSTRSKILRHAPRMSSRPRSACPSWCTRPALPPCRRRYACRAPGERCVQVRRARSSLLLYHNDAAHRRGPLSGATTRSRSWRRSAARRPPIRPSCSPPRGAGRS